MLYSQARNFNTRIKPEPRTLKSCEQQMYKTATLFQQAFFFFSSCCHCIVMKLFHKLSAALWSGENLRQYGKGLLHYLASNASKYFNVCKLKIGNYKQQL